MYEVFSVSLTINKSNEKQNITSSNSIVIFPTQKMRPSTIFFSFPQNQTNFLFLKIVIVIAIYWKMCEKGGINFLNKIRSEL